MNHKRQILNDPAPPKRSLLRENAPCFARTLRRGESPRRVAVASERRIKAAPRAAFTLIELLVVMLIIVLLAGMTISVSKYANWRARKAKADIELQKIRSALDEYRAVYGEYPIVGDPGHYPDNWPTDTATAENVPPPFRYVDLVNTTTNPIDIQLDTKTQNSEGFPGVEYLPLISPTRVDYRLTYALKLRPESEGRPPFMDFPMVTACFIVWKDVSLAHAGYHSIYNRDGILVDRKWYVKGDPVNRIMAIHPVSRRQWHYTCNNGTMYILTDGTVPNGSEPARNW